MSALVTSFPKAKKVYNGKNREISRIYHFFWRILFSNEPCLERLLFEIWNEEQHKYIT